MRLALLPLLVGCAIPSSFAAPSAATDAPAAPWFYADVGEGIDWDSLALQGSDVAFRTVGSDLGSGPVARGASIAESLACGRPTRITVGLRDGAVDRVWTSPEAPCVERRARAVSWEDVDLGALRAEDTTHALVILDVPAAASFARVTP